MNRKSSPNVCVFVMFFVKKLKIVYFISFNRFSMFSKIIKVVLKFFSVLIYEMKPQERKNQILKESDCVRITIREEGYTKTHLAERFNFNRATIIEVLTRFAQLELRQDQFEVVG